MVVELRGELAAILQLCAGAGHQNKEPGISAGLDIDQVKLVAGARNHRQFRLPPIEI
ncbi:MAG TPA: hypothetical protein VM659_11695 [Dongiaceae bacterium]|nr:hypothetical protein [Dongiaceae bacterium]